MRYRPPIVPGYWGWALSSFEPFEPAGAKLLAASERHVVPKAWRRDLSALLVLAVAILQARFR